MIGTAISHYRIIDKLGEDGMIVVHKKPDIRLEGSAALRLVAIHLFSDEDAQTRYRQWASIGLKYSFGLRGGCAPVQPHIT